LEEKPEEKEKKRKGKKKRKPRPASKKWELYKLERGKIAPKRKFCPKCGPGVFMGEHKNRWTCGRCGYTEFKGK
jgi:small subunit ribosomal protein S27Ae